jgi:DNA modification methylase
VIQGNALDELKKLESESVHCCVTSPPYWGLRSYLNDGDPLKPYELGNEATPEEYVEHMVEVFREVRRVLRKDGNLWLNLGDAYAHPGKSGPWDEKRSQFSPKQTTPGYMYRRQANRGDLPGLKAKDLCMIPAEVAIALRNDGWYLRCDVVWEKPNGMPSSQEDRPTRNHEYVFLLTKQSKYFYDAEAIKESYSQHSRPDEVYTGQAIKGYAAAKAQNPSDTKRRILESMRNGGGRNCRSVWTIPTQPCSFAHFAVMPEALAERCIKAGTSAAGVCAKCGAPWVRVVERESRPNWNGGERQKHDGTYYRPNPGGGLSNDRRARTEKGWRPTCSCGGEPVPATVLDPFAGAGTTLYVAEKLGRNSIGIELNPSYIEDIIKPRMAEIRYIERPMFA